LKEFHVNLKWGTSGDFKVTMSQGGNSVSMSNDCGTKIINNLKEGMAFSISSWQDSGTWLSRDRCKPQTCTLEHVYYKNLSITTGSVTTPQTPSDNTYGN